MKLEKYILVTGGAGYIGSHTVVELIKSNFIPIILDDFRNAKDAVIQRLEKITGTQLIVERASCHNAEVMDRLSKKYNFWGVIHFAADKAVGESVAEPLKYYQNNLGGLVSVLEWMKRNTVKNLVFSSSCTVYGDPDKKAVNELTPTQNPTSPYGKTKLMCEEILKDFSTAHSDFSIVALRYFNPIGAHQTGLIGEEPQGIPNNLLPYITQTAAGLRKKLTVYGNDYNTVDGTCVRDYIHVTDLANAHVKALDYIHRNTTCTYEVFNIGTGKGTSVLAFIQMFEDIINKPLNWEYGARRSGDVPEIFAEVDKAQNLLSWKARYSVKDAIASSWKWELYKKEL
ncbi:MAG: UDP-glucose 4-epimerase GalE [Lishizhenia sp.]